MRATPRPSYAVLYALGLVWVVALFGAALVLTGPLELIYETLAIEGLAVRVAATVTTAVVMATSVTVGIGLVLRATMAQERATERPAGVRGR